MHMIAPRLGDAEEITVAEEQLEFKPLVVACFRYPDDDPDYPGMPFVVSRWTFTQEERARIAAGEDIVIAHLTGGGPMQPLAPQVGTQGYDGRPR